MRALALALLLPLAALADEYTAVDRLLLGTTTVLMIADWGQTRAIAAQPQRFSESNPLLGKHPSQERVDRHFTIVLAATWIGYNVLPQAERRIILLGLTMTQLGVVIHNHGIGVRAQF